MYNRRKGIGGNPYDYQTDLKKFQSKSKADIASLKTQAIELGLSAMGGNPICPQEPINKWKHQVNNLQLPFLSKMQKDEKNIFIELSAQKERLRKPLKSLVRYHYIKLRPEWNYRKIQLHHSKKGVIEATSKGQSLALEVNKLKAMRDMEGEKFGYNLPTSGVIDSKLMPILMFLLIAGSEYAISLDIFIKIGVITLAGKVFSIAIPLLIWLSSELMGRGLAYKRWLEFYISLSIGLLGVGLLIGLRWYADVALWQSMMNFLFWLAGGLVSYSHYYRKTYLRLTSLINKKERNIAKLENLVLDNAAENLMRKDHLDANMKSLAITKAMEEQDELKEQIVVLTNYQAQVNLQKDNLIALKSTAEKEGIKAFNEGFAYGVSQRKNGGFRKWAAAFFLLMLMVISSCQPSVPTQSDNMIFIDATFAEKHKNTYNPMALHRTIFEDTDSLTRDKITLEIIEINNLIIQSPKRIEPLPYWKQPLMDVQNNRVAIFKDFKNRTANFIKSELSKERKELPRTELNRCLCNNLARLGQSPAQQKTAYILSDGLEFSDISFLKYEKHPKALKMDAEYLLKQLEQQCKIPILNDVDIKFIYQPNIDNQFLVQNAMEIWKNRLESAGATVSFQATL